VRLPQRLAAVNHRGRRLPTVLGIGIAAGTGLTLLVRDLIGPGVSAQEAIAAAGAGIVLAGGLIDDLVPIGPRGLRNHLRELLAGRITTGIVKLIVIAGASVVVVATIGPPGRVPAAAGVALLMGTTNLWNGLDVRPGRAIKSFLAISLLLVAVDPPWGPDAPLFRSIWPWTLLALVPDLRERAMLGDAGANLLGFAIGLALLGTVGDTALVVLALAGVALNVIADTVTLSRVIDAVPPLRWFDRLGRSAEPPSGPEPSPPSSEP
jgi:UDP-GlcNAc:undecaprenyl-phosphate GlcNAc-1-phosphate transferase